MGTIGTIRDAMKGVITHPLPERSCTPYPSIAPKVSTQLEHVVYMNFAHHAYIATTYVWRAKTPPVSSVQMCPLVALRRDIKRDPSRLPSNVKGHAAPPQVLVMPWLFGQRFGCEMLPKSTTQYLVITLIP